MCIAGQLWGARRRGDRRLVYIRLSDGVLRNDTQSKDVEELKKQAAAFAPAEVLKTVAGYPRVVSETEVAGLAPGQHALILGVCEEKIHAERARDVSNVYSAEGVVVKALKVAMPLLATCPWLLEKPVQFESFLKVKRRELAYKKVPYIHWVVRSGMAPWNCRAHAYSLELSGMVLWSEYLEDNCVDGEPRRLRPERKIWTLETDRRWNLIDGEEWQPDERVSNDENWYREFDYALLTIGNRRVLAIDTYLDERERPKRILQTIAKAEYLSYLRDLRASTNLVAPVCGKLRTLTNQARWWGIKDLEVHGDGDSWPRDALVFSYKLISFSNKQFDGVKIPRHSRYRWSLATCSYDFETDVEVEVGVTPPDALEEESHEKISD